MLHYKSITADTLELLKQIQATKAFKNLRLVGGTGLALQLGHRVSIDLDLFGNLECDKISLVESLKAIGETKIIQTTENINIFSVNGIKVDIVNYKYDWLDSEITDNGIVVAGIHDIAAMKLAAITGRGAKKDFIDLYFLLQKISLKELLNLYHKKYTEGTSFLVLKSLTYFDDADDEPMPNIFGSLDWEHVKDFIRQQVKEL